jgi:hypothetical protein
MTTTPPTNSTSGSPVPNPLTDELSDEAKQELAAVFADLRRRWNNKVDEIQAIRRQRQFWEHTVTVVILSPHTDDAIFSLGQHLTTLDSDVPLVIASVFAGIPEDDAGHKKHKRLRAEHELACEIIGASEWNGDYLDDVYQPRPSVTEIRDWIVKAVHRTRRHHRVHPVGDSPPRPRGRHSRSDKNPPDRPHHPVVRRPALPHRLPRISRCTARAGRRNTRPTQTTRPCRVIGTGNSTPYTPTNPKST